MRVIPLSGLSAWMIIAFVPTNAVRHDGEDGMIVSWPTAGMDYPMHVPHGSDHDAVFYTLTMFSENAYSMRMQYSAVSPLLKHDEEEPFDAAYRISWFSVEDDSDQKEYWFFFRRGFLVGKCPVQVGDNRKLHTVYERDIASGLHHPPSYPGLLSHVIWGAATGYRLTTEEKRKTDTDQAALAESALHRPRLRCGIATENLPPFAVRNKLNILVLIQNVDDDPLELRMPWDAWVVSGCALGAFEKGSDETAEPKVVGQSLLRLMSGTPGRFVGHEFFLAPIRLKRNECLWFWFRSTVAGHDRVVLRARARLLGINSENRDSEYRLSCEIASTRVRPLED